MTSSPSPSPVRLGPTIEIDGTFNARDVGGVTNADGRTLATGVLYRSAALDRVGDSGRRDLAQLGVRSIADLRASAEIERHGAFDVADSGIAWRHLDSKFGPPSLSDEGVRVFTDHDDPMAHVYGLMMTEGVEMFADGLRMLAGEAETPMLIHCTSGKDRTGMLAAMAQLICGVPMATVLADYERSSLAAAVVHDDMVERYPEMSAAGHEKVARMAGTDPAWLLGAFDLIGGVDALSAWLDTVGVTAAHTTEIRRKFAIE